MKYTKELMENACVNAKSIAQVCKNLGLKPVGGNYNTVKRNLEKFGIDTSYFTGQRWNKGLQHLEATARIPLENILKENISYSSTLLRKRLINAKIKEHKCEICGHTENLELHHINGDHYDNRIENIQILCPSCHAKTDNFRGRSTHKNSTPEMAERKNSKSHWCICKNCNKEFYSDRIDRTRKFCCRECYNEYLIKIQKNQVDPLQQFGNGNIKFKSTDLSLESIKEQIEKCSSIQEIADNLNSNRTTIRNYLKKYNLYEKFKLKYDFNAIPVIQYDGQGNKIKEFLSVTDAASFIGLKSIKGICNCCKGRQRSAAGFVWRYKD